MFYSTKCKTQLLVLLALAALIMFYRRIAAKGAPLKLSSEKGTPFRGEEEEEEEARNAID